MSEDLYYRVGDARIGYLGERYFKFNPTTNKVIQVCANVGEVKKGKGNTFGVYLIHKLTFFSNYLAMGYVMQITKEEYEFHFNRIFEMLK